MKRCFIFKDDKSQKFWNIELNGAGFTVVYGRLGTDGQTQNKSFDNDEKCIKEAEKLIAEKVKKGYLEVTEDDVKESKDEARRYGYDYDTWDDKSNDDLMNKILTDKKLPQLKHITIANWKGACEAESCQPILDAIVEHKDKFQHIETLRVGDLSQEEIEVSWIPQGDYAALLAALPNLKGLFVQGSTEGELAFGELNHNNLESLEIMGGGLPVSVIRSITNAKLPNLKKLRLYIGVADYGFDGNIDDIKKLLSDSDFPKLEYLGLCNTDFEIANDTALAAVTSKYAPRIHTLDLSSGVVTDIGAQHILDHAANLKSLQLLDLEYHYIGQDYMAKLKKLPFKVNLADPQEYDEEDPDFNFPMLTE